MHCSTGAGWDLGDQYWTFAATLNPLSHQQHNKQIVRIICDDGRGSKIQFEMEQLSVTDGEGF